MIGFAITGSFCTLSKVPGMITQIMDRGHDVLPVISETVQNTDTRFYEANDFINSIESLAGNEAIKSIKDAEPIGPKGLLDAIIIAPCTGNTLAKIANGITDTCVTMACKAHLRNGRPLVIFLSTNDGLGMNAKNIGILMNTKNIFFVPFGQDDPEKKCNSLVSYPVLAGAALEEALAGRQLQPVIL